MFEVLRTVHFDHPLNSTPARLHLLVYREFEATRRCVHAVNCNMHVGDMFQMKRRATR